ncbi:MAG: XdhC/CoxF family protein, partial [FCB group bacterium]|nr:XdhC/CoxF family protein [FCB group bacterium]
QHDLLLLRDILKHDVSYIGLMSSRRKWRILSEALLAEGFSPESVGKVHAPIGLDIHSKTVPEIAVSIISEIIREYRS